MVLEHCPYLIAIHL